MQNFPTPDWVKDAVFYQIFPDRFAKSDKVSKPSNLEPWDAPPTLYGFKGGDLLGVVEKLDYLQDVGFNALYFCPILQSTANHRYHTHDYKVVDPLLGGNEALRTLLDEAHRRGMRVIIDGVFNHASRGFFQFSHILENGPRSPYLDWFTVYGWPLNPYDRSRPPNYAAWWNDHALPKLNTGNPQVREMIWSVAQQWIDFGVDGWRLDVPNEIDDDSFWQEFRRRVKGANPDAYIVGEIWDPAQRWLRGDQFDAVMNYLFFRGALSFCAQGTLHPGVRHRWHHWTLEAMSGTDLLHWINQVLALYPRSVNEVQLNLLDSHDTPRFLTMAQSDTGALRLAILFQMTYVGAPCLYYGDEIGIGAEPLPQPWDAADDPACRPGMPWDPARWDEDLRQYVKRAIALRTAHPVLRRGAYRALGADQTLYAFERRLGAEQMIVVLNAAKTPRTVSFPAPAGLADGQTLVDIWGGAQAHVAGGAIRDLALPAQGGAVLLVPPGAAVNSEQ